MNAKTTPEDSKAIEKAREIFERLLTGKKTPSPRRPTIQFPSAGIWVHGLA